MKISFNPNMTFVDNVDNRLKLWDKLEKII